MNYFWAFCVGGAICVAGQLLIDLTGLTPARILTGYVVAGVVLSAIAKRVFDLLDDAHKFTRLNVGTAGVNKKPGEEYVAIIPQVYTTAEELAAARALHNAGVTVFGQANPTLESADFDAIERAFR